LAWAFWPSRKPPQDGKLLVSGAIDGWRRIMAGSVEVAEGEFEPGVVRRSIFRDWGD
jgi:hypothetical protein